MGLDTVELVMAIEEEFGIAIPDDVAPQLARLVDLHAYAVQALRQRPRMRRPIPARSGNG